MEDFKWTKAWRLPTLTDNESNLKFDLNKAKPQDIKPGVFNLCSNFHNAMSVVAQSIEAIKQFFVTSDLKSSDDQEI